MNLDQIASDGSCLRTDRAALSAQGFSANYPFIASTQFQLGLGIPLSTSPSALANQVRRATHGLAVFRSAPDSVTSWLPPRRSAVSLMR
ncbi:hypothetical protein G6F22_020114 [Rhizopus arrhizus]|nr:hypothetical protein G6F22_020114 [Rhizopus arrhizus]